MNEDEDRTTTRAKLHNFDTPGSISINTFVYTAIKYWNALPDRIKEIKNGDVFKENVVKHLREEAEKAELSQFK